MMIPENDGKQIRREKLPGSDYRTVGRREKRRLAQRVYRRRIDAGRMMIAVEIDGAVVEMLIANHWLQDGDSEDRKQIAWALAAMLAEAAAKR